MDIHRFLIVFMLLAMSSSLTVQATDYSHNPNYTCLAGQLVWNDIEGGHWQIQYVDPKDAKAVAADRYRGRLTLGTPTQLRDLKHGQWVEITGRVRADVSTIWMTGELFELKTDRALGLPPASARLTDAEVTLSAQAERMRQASQRFPAEFTADKNLSARIAGPKDRTSRFILIEYRGDQWSPQLIDADADAKTALQKHIAADTGNFVHSYRRPDSAVKLVQDEKIVAQSSNAFYHRFDTSFRTTDETWRLTYVVLRPGFLSEVVGQHGQWLRAGDCGLVFGKTALADQKALTDAADLLVRLIYLDDGPILLDRKVAGDDKLFRWTGTLATYVRSPVSDRDWTFESLTLEVDRSSGGVSLQVGGRTSYAPHGLSSDPWSKVEFDLTQLDKDGLRGPPDGKVSVSYEFCIPNTEECKTEVKAIDQTLQFAPGSSGRIGAGKHECLCIGATRKDYTDVLKRLSALPYVKRIIECYFE